VLLLLITIVSCTTTKSIIEQPKYVFPPIPESPVIIAPPGGQLDSKSMEDLQKILTSWSKQKSLTSEQQSIVGAICNYDMLILSWQKWATVTIHNQDTTVKLWGVWAEDVQDITQGRAVK
jgi:hypothetical protein